MTAPFQELATLDRLIHEPARLAIMTALETLNEADFIFLQRLTGLTKGNLSSHLVTLEKGDFVEIDKSYRGKTPLTRIRLTTKGRLAIQKHWQRLSTLRSASARSNMDSLNRRPKLRGSPAAS